MNRTMAHGKKGQAMGIGSLQSVAIAFVLVTVTIAIGAYLVNEVGDQLPADSVAQNVTADGLAALDVFGGWLTILVVIVVAAVILGLLALYQRFR